MNISYNWLRELTATRMSPRELAQQLTRVGLTVEGVHEAGGDHLLDIDLTSNRPDCLSHLGVSREVAAIAGARLSWPQGAPPAIDGSTAAHASVEILAPDLCPRYAARIVRGVKIGPSPDWLVRRLEAIGQRPINNVADITNYVLHEQGQPLHAFDLAKLVGQRIIVRRATPGEKLKTLDGCERELDGEMLVIADAARPVAVAGVMGGEDSEISAATRDVLIESAYFDPASVRRTARLLGLHTEASHRFERGVDYEGVLRAQERCVALVCELAGGTATGDAIDVYPEPLRPPLVSLRPERVKALTGLEVAPDEALRILAALGFIQSSTAQGEAGAQSPGKTAGPSHQGTNSRLSFIAPTWRVDIAIEEDLVEEVARYTGYEKITTELPASNIAGEYQATEGKRRALRRAVTAAGYDEAISFSFIDAAHDERFELLPGLVQADEERFITLSNPIIEGSTRMRPTLLPGLLEAVRHNLNRGTRDIRLFETGRVFAANAESGQLPIEREALALAATGSAVEEGRAGGARELDFYDLKGALEAAIDEMRLEPLRFEATSARHLRDGQSARISTADGRTIGAIGRLDETVAAGYKFRQAVYVAELDLSALLESAETPALYTPLPRYPSIMRDLSLLVSRSMTFAAIVGTVDEQQLEHCRSLKLVDVYEGANLPEGKRSVTVRIEYRADDRTLRDEEVDVMHARILQALEERFGAQLR
ncbi:MAG TPA: phenylalanine--tRNA ligase subunit beta [Pyrinomonadaceae bacterium]|jgi:phenylalanyl-tRNA synthetase beta chain